MIEIRGYADADYEAVQQILKESGMFDLVWDRRENLKKKISRNPDSILVAVVDGKIVGSVYITADGWEALIFHLAVKKEYRRKGIGSDLLKEVDNSLRQRGIKELSFFVDADNQELLEFYKKRGYEASAKLYRNMHKVLVE